MTKVIVIGGGIVGASAAYRLARAHVNVTLVDRSDLGQATAAGAGIVAPGLSFEPAPFYPLAQAAVSFYSGLVAQLGEDGEAATGYETVGALFLATSQAEAARLPEVQRMVEERRAGGMGNIGEVSRLDGKQARELFPALAEVPGAIHISGGARVDGRLLRDAMVRGARKHGARVVQGDAALVREGDRVTGVRVGGEMLAADAVLVAGGAWSNAVAEQLGVRIPVEPQRGQIMHMEMPGAGVGRWPILLGFHSHYMLTFPDNRVVAGATRETGLGYDCRMTAGGVHEVLSEALRIAPGVAGATVKEIRIGFRPASPDSLPILGRAPELANLYLATGHGANGLLLGPYSGAAVADLIQGTPPAADLAPFGAGRFRAAAG